MIKVTCVCGRKIAAPDKFLNKRVKCPQCGRPVMVAPAESPAAAPVVETPQLAPMISQPAIPAAPTVAEASSPPAAELESPAPAAAAEDFPTEPVAAETPIAQEATATPNLIAIEPVSANGEAKKTPAALAAKEVMNAEAPPAAPRPIFKTTLPSEVLDAAGFEPEPGEARLPTLLGLAALLIGGAGAGALWLTVFAKWSLDIAIAGGVFALLGIIISLARRRAGLVLPVIGLLICGAAAAQPWVAPTMGGPGLAGYPQSTQRKSSSEDAAMREGESRAILSVDFLRPVRGSKSIVPEYSYKLTNRSGKAIKLIDGSIQFFDRDHNPLGGMHLSIKTPIANNASLEGQDEWPVDPRLQDMIAGNQTSAEFRAEAVVYGDGSTQTFAH